MSAPGRGRIEVAVRAAVATLADRGAVRVLKDGQPVDAHTARGPIRLQINDADP